jgi:hypothetical protein
MQGQKDHIEIGGERLNRRDDRFCGERLKLLVGWRNFRWKLERTQFHPGIGAECDIIE